MTFVPVPGFARLVEVTRSDPWVSWGLPRAEPLLAWHDADADARAVAVSRTRQPYGTSLFLLPLDGAPLGPPTVAAALALVPAGREASLTVPAGSTAAVTAAWAAGGGVPGPGIGWEWRWTTSAPPAVPGEERVVELAGADPRVIGELSAMLTHSPRHSATPGRDDVAGWAGVRVAGRLVACAAWLELVPGVPLLASVAVHPDARLQGLAAALTAWVTRRALAAGAQAVTVDLYADNDTARRVYERLGFARAHDFVSWSPLTPG